MLSADEILKIPPSEARKLFPGAPKDVKSAFRSFAKTWHPDRCADPRAAQVFEHLESLKNRVLPKEKVRDVEQRLWIRADGTSVRYSLQRRSEGDFGDVLVGRTSVAYETPAGFEDLAENEKARIAAIRYADDAMRAQFSHFMPEIVSAVSATDRTVTILRRPEDCVLLSDLIAHFGGRVPAVHVAWIVSSLENICCFLAWQKVSHGAISPANVLVCPARHSAVLVGGWGFSTEFGKPYPAVPSRTCDAVPAVALDGSVADCRTDLALVRRTAREALGSTAARGILGDPGIPEPVARWLLAPPKATAKADYESWGECLTEAWGRRTFVKMDVDPRQIYSS
jgi:hypothetical protein